MAHDILRYLQERNNHFMLELASWASVESCTDDREGLQTFSAIFANRVRNLRMEVEPLGPGGARLLARWSAGEGAPILLVGHGDTVYPRGTLARQPVEERDGRLFGPGVYDMKGGLLAMCAAVEALQATGRTPRRPVLILMTDDEEIGSPTSRPYIEQVAREAAAVLVLEPATPAGALKTARKGVATFELEITGRAAHAGVAPHQGRSALVELAHQILWLSGLNQSAMGTTVNVGIAEGGTAFNVVPASATAKIDVRVQTHDEAERITQLFAERRPVTPDVTLRFSGGLRNPPMERTAANSALFEQARTLALELGFEVAEGSSGGASDGNFTAALGIPTLDGLGPLGDGAHAVHEHIVVDEFPRRAAMLARLIETLA